MFNEDEVPTEEQPTEVKHPDGQTSFQRAMNTPVAQSNVQVAALLVFERGITIKDIEQIIQQFDNDDAPVTVTLREFDPTLGGYPVLYFP